MPDDLHHELDEVNRGLADEAQRLAAQLDSAEGRQMLAHVWGALQPERMTVGRLRAGARAFTAFIGLHPAGDGEPLSRIGVPIFPGQDGLTPVAARDAGQVMALGSLYLGLADLADGPQFARLRDALVGADVVNTVLRHALVGKPALPRPRVPPDPFDYIRDFAQRHCVAGVTSAALGLSRTLRAHDLVSYADGITAVDPPQGCGGQLVTIRGAGFGTAQPPNVEVYLPTRVDTCRPAQVAPSGWTDSTVTVTAPADVGTGCVGFVADRAGVAYSSDRLLHRRSDLLLRAAVRGADPGAVGERVRQRLSGALPAVPAGRREQVHRWPAGHRVVPGPPQSRRRGPSGYQRRPEPRRHTRTQVDGDQRDRSADQCAAGQRSAQDSMGCSVAPYTPNPADDMISGNRVQDPLRHLRASRSGRKRSWGDRSRLVSAVRWVGAAGWPGGFLDGTRFWAREGVGV